MKAPVLLGLFFAAGLLTARAADPASPASAHWEGKLQLDSTHELDMTLDLDRTPQGTWVGTIGFPKSTTRDVPLEGLKVTDATVEFAAHVPYLASFTATVGADGGELNGAATAPEGSSAFQLKRNGAASVKLPPPSTPLSAEFAGAWEGTLQSPRGTRTVKLALSAGPDRAATGTLTVVAEKTQEFLITTVTIQNKELQLELRSISGRYTGTLGDTGEITGEWSQGPNKLPLVFKRAKP